MHDCSVCVLGASAGGLSALTEFFRAIPQNPEVAFVVIQHLSPDHTSIMDKLLAPHVSFPIEVAGDRILLEPNTVYLCPPGVIPRAAGRYLYLDPRDVSESLFLPIDLYLTGLAHTLGDKVIAVILSGTGSDGSEGIKQVRQCGGQVFVQDPASADFSGMPQSAISTGVVHGVAPAGELWALILQLSGQKSNLQTESFKPLIATDEDMIENNQYELLLDYLNECFELDFSKYHIKSVGRRIERRMQLLSIKKIDVYFEYLRQSDDETNLLYHDLLIGVTAFFRDTDAYAALAKAALTPALEKHTEKEFRIWVVGCATGQEAYSLYMLASEVKQAVGYHGRISMFATDISLPSIQTAGNGVYSAELMQSVSDARRQTYFREMSPSLYKIRPEVRENIIFAQHNFLVNAPFTNMDMVACRNVLIYLIPDAQDAAIRSFSYALKQGGILFLGGSESLGKLVSAFKTVSSKEKIFAKQNSTLDSKSWMKAMSAPSQNKTKGLRYQSSLNTVAIDRNLLSAYDSLIERFALCGFLINREREILHLFGQASDFFTRNPGRVNSNLLSQLNPELTLVLTTLTHQAISKLITVRSKGIRCASSRGPRVVDLTVGPLKDPKGQVQVFLVEIIEREPTAQPKKNKESPDLIPEKVDLKIQDQLRFLEEELALTKENLEAANEELQVSNEELQSMNEEMQVANEELQNSNEELNSLNEELSTLNAEYERKNEELIETNISHQNLLESTEDGVLFVDKDLRIRNYNPAIATAFNLLPSDIGRPIDHIAYNLEGKVSLAEGVRQVMRDGQREESDTLDRDGRHYLKRMVPFRRADGGIEGVLISFTNVSQYHDLLNRFNFAIEAVGMSWWDWDLRTDKLSVHSSGDCLLGKDCSVLPRDYKGWMDCVHPDDRLEVEQSLKSHLAGETESWRCEHRFKMVDEKWLWVMNCGRVMSRDQNGAALEMMGTTQDINAYKQALIRSNYQRELLETADVIAKVGSWEFDAGKEIITWSEQTRSILEVDDDFEATVEACYALMDPDDRPRLKAAFEATIERGEAYDLELKFITAKGRRILARSAGKPVYDDKGRLVKVIGIFQDITEMVRTKHEMEAYFAMSPDFQATLNLEGAFQSVSLSWSQALGYTDEQLSQMKVFELIHPEYLYEFRQVISGIIEGDVVNSLETKVIVKDRVGLADEGDATWMSWSLSADPQLGLIFVSARCVTEQKQASQQLEAAVIRAEEANRAKSEFLAVMSHELRTPLNPILGFAEMLLDEVESEDHQMILQTIVSSGKHLVRLIDEVLDYAKIEAGKLEVMETTFSLPDFVEEKVNFMRGQLLGRDVAIQCEVDAGPFGENRLPEFVGDTSMLQHIVRNLLSNAIKFTKEGSIHLRAVVESKDDKRATVRFEVKDTGIGIAASKQSEIFEPFIQADSSHTREYGGTGLGLAICKRLVSFMGGEFQLESELGKGATFSFAISMAYRFDVESEKAVKGFKLKPIRPVANGCEVLVVEDNRSNVFLVEALLSRLGCPCTVAMNGEEALVEIQQRAESFPVILLDLHMPGIGGQATLKKIREREKTEGLSASKIYIVSADVHPSVKEQCTRLGADGFINKPVKISVLRDILESISSQ